MQTFLPAYHFSDCAKILDNARLTKQQTETLGILNTLEGRSEAWKNHPAVKQWVGFESCLWNYGIHISKECSNRNFKSFHVFSSKEIDRKAKVPPWIGYEPLHSSHRSRLLFKGRVDTVCYALRDFWKIDSINEWLEHNGFPQKNVFKHCHVEQLEELAKEINCPVPPNFYLKYGWLEDDTQGYIWPTKIPEFSSNVPAPLTQ